jgi:adenosylmethionine-8-amino-7-oxononanoate aminotransferase
MGIADRDSKVVWHPFTQYATEAEMIPVVRAEGIWLYAEDGSRYMDVNGSWWVNLHGHAHPQIAQAIADQARQLEHVIFAGVTHAPAVHLAEQLINRTSGWFSRVFFSDNGSTAVEVALKMAVQYWHNKGESRQRFIALEGAYHGDTFGAMSVGARDTFNEPFEQMFFQVDFIPVPDASSVDEVVKRMEALVSRDDVAGFIYEPLIQGAAGMVMYSAEHLNRLLKVADNAGVLRIADEVFTGFGRTGTWFASQQCAIAPHLMALSKGLTGGALPMGVTLAPEWLFQAFIHPEKRRAFLHGHSFTANPLACAAANASIQLMEQPQTWENIETIGRMHRGFVAELQRTFAQHSAQSLGTVLRVSLNTADQQGYYNSIRSDAYAYFMKKGLLIRPLGNVIYVNPPYCIKVAELQLVYQAIREYLTRLQ